MRLYGIYLGIGVFSFKNFNYFSSNSFFKRISGYVFEISWYPILDFNTNRCKDLTLNVKVTEQVRGSKFSKIVIFGVHKLCGLGFLMQKEKPEISFHSGVLVSFLLCTVQRSQFRGVEVSTPLDNQGI